jgi:ElaB/YqjD/DUF883 family membrane-anchored ribosome-binding protein
MDDATGRVGRKKKTTSGATATPEREQVDPTLPEETDARAQEIREEIAQTREDMSETIEAIQDRLRPGNIVANATERVKSATTEKVMQMANTAEDAADRVMHNSFMDTVRDNPWPVAMIGIGAAWLWMKGRSDSRYYTGTGRYRYGSDYPRGDYTAENDWRTRTAPTRMVYGSEGYLHTTGYEGVSEDRGYTGSDDSRSDYRGADYAGAEYARDAGYAARRSARRAQNGFNRVVRENPLALGAAATIVGAAIGMTLPETDVENEWMGEARDTVVDRAREAASNAAERVQDTAEQVKDAASRAVDATKGSDR